MVSSAPEELLAAWEADLRSMALLRMPLTDERHRATLTAMPIGELMVRFLNWRDRLVHPHRRAVYLPPGFKTSRRYLNFQLEISELLAKFENGADVTPHLSRRIRHGYDEDRQGRAGARSLDLMLNDWGIHHLHISCDIQADGFVKGADDLLFVIFRPDRAFVLGIYRHSRWAEEDVVNVAIDNWPEARLFLPLQGVIRQERQVTPDDRMKQRANGFAMLIAIDDAVYMPPGISSAGTSTQASMKWVHLCRVLRSYATNLEATIGQFKAMAEREGREFPANPKFQVVDVSGQTSFGLALCEPSSGQMLWLN